jgi:hypothetical protein
MANPNIVTSKTFSTVNAFLPAGNLWSISTPPATCDGYILVVANAAGLVPAINDPNNSLLWFMPSAASPANFSFAQPTGYTSGLTVIAAPLPAPLGQSSEQSWGTSVINIQWPSAPDAALALIFAIQGDSFPNWLTWDRGVIDGPIFFSGDNTTDVNKLNWSANTFDTLNLEVMVTDNGSASNQPNGFTNFADFAINGSHSIRMTAAYKNTVGASINSAQLSWQGSGTNMANIVWSMSDAAGVSGALADSVAIQNRQQSKVRMLHRVNK